MQDAMRVLIADNDRDVSRALAEGMEADAISADVVGTGRDALEQAVATPYSAILLDVTLPDVDGFAVCERMRDQGVEAPIIFLTARGAVTDRVRGLRSGADDYMVKPFALRELLARIDAVCRRGPVLHPLALRCGDLTLDLVRHQAQRGDTAVPLSRREFGVLEVLMREPGHVLSRVEILDRAWGDRLNEASNVVDVYVGYLRRKIDRPFERNSLQTIRGLGYRITADA